MFTKSPPSPAKRSISLPILSPIDERRTFQNFYAAMDRQTRQTRKRTSFWQNERWIDLCLALTLFVLVFMSAELLPRVRRAFAVEVWPAIELRLQTMAGVDQYARFVDTFNNFPGRAPIGQIFRVYESIVGKQDL